MKRMNEYTKQQTQPLLHEHEWKWFITIHQNEPDVSHQWLLITEAIERLRLLDDTITYWFCFAQGSLSWKYHAHGVIQTSLSRSVVKDAFRECNEPSIKPVVDVDRLIGYLMKQALETTINNIGE